MAFSSDQLESEFTFRYAIFFQQVRSPVEEHVAFADIDLGRIDAVELIVLPAQSFKR